MLETHKIMIKKLMVEFDNGRLPDTEFIDSFMPRMDKKQKNDWELTVREKEVLSELFEKY